MRDKIEARERSKRPPLGPPLLFVPGFKYDVSYSLTLAEEKKKSDIVIYKTASDVGLHVSSWNSLLEGK